jgi:FAD/FMN-containing dehydrogenase
MNVFDPFYDPSDLSACVDASMTVAELNARAQGDSIYFPLWRDPSESLGSLYLHTRLCSRSFRFGMMGDNTLGCRFELRNGKTLDLGGRVVKNVVGLDLTRFFSGSQGRLGRPQRLVLRLRPLPEIRRELEVRGSLEELEAFRSKFMASAWVHCVDAFDFSLDASGCRLGLAYACTKAESQVFESSLAALAQPCRLSQAPLPSHAAKPASSLLVPLSQVLWTAKDLHARYGGRISGYLGQGLLLCEASLPAGQPSHLELESRLLAALEALP